MRIIRFASMAISLAVGMPAMAADLTPVVSEPTPPMVLEDGWKFQATLYGWATALNGDVGIKGLPPQGVDVSFADILKNLDGAFMGSLYASNGTWSVLTDAVWAKLSTDINVGSFGGTAKFEQKQAILSGVVGYRLPIGPPNLDLSATAGVRYNHLASDINIDPAFFPGVSREGTKGWVDPIVGLSVHYAINDKWFINALGDVGGFGVGSNFTTQGFAAVGYNWTKTISTSIGYRVIYTDYKDGGFVYDVTQHGLFTGLGIHF